MATISETHSRGAAQPPEQQLRCISCGTDEFLVIDSIESHVPAVPNIVEVAYTCTECRSFYAHAASVEQVAAILNRPGISFGVLKFGGEYIHCGEPMKTASSGFRSISAPLSTESRHRDRAFDVYLQTRVLRCSCGFQMEIPD